MKKKMVYVAAALIIGAVTVFNVKTVLDANRNYDLAMTSIDALSEDGEGESGESGGGSGDQESNEHGSGQFFYEDRKGKPDFCTLFRYIHINGQIVNAEKEQSLSAEWTLIKVEGLKDKCPKEGNGCTAYSCQSTN